MTQAQQSAIRHLLSIVGGIVVAHGFLTQSQAELIAGPATALIGAVWGIYDEHRAEKLARQNPAHQPAPLINPIG